MDETAAENAAEPSRCAYKYCGRPMPPKPSGIGGRVAKFCGVNCRKADHRLATAAKAARTRIEPLRKQLDQALTDAERALNRLHISGLSEEETGGLTPERSGDIETAVRRAVEKLRYTARERRDAIATAASHPAGADPDAHDE
jgi:hypothetical protein